MMKSETYEYENEILSLDEKNKILGEIYLIINKQNGMKYVGQTVTHRKNKGKYRPFGSNGRFNDHISEAINNTKKKQCTFLNNAIRKYGKENFEFSLIQRCTLNELDELESMWIKNHDSLYPNGYNLTKGGKTGSTFDTGEKILNETKKRGRDFGYTHKEETINKMKERAKNNPKSNKVRDKLRETMSNSIKAYYDQKKIDELAKLELEEDIEQYIKPIRNKNTGLIHDYKIKVGVKMFEVISKKDTLDEKYNRLLSVLEKAKIKAKTTN